MDEQTQVPLSGVKSPVQKNMLLYGIGVAVLIICIVVGYWFFTMREKTPEALDPASAGEETSFGDEVSRRVLAPAEDAAESIPDANPLGEIEANPYSGYENPFNR